MNISSSLLNWYKTNKRELPWRDTGNPYQIWLSEIILQQTRIDQGMGYFHRIYQRFPDIHSLASASEDEVLSLWQGLGYYSRARNLHHTAKTISAYYGGAFPPDYHELKKLKGIGSYTAAAIASIAFNIPVAAIDGNVSRVISRLFAIETPIDNSSTRKIIENLADEILDTRQPGDFNQAMMDLGSMICKPTNPLCQQCPLFDFCLARAKKTEHLLPVKSKKIKQRKRYFHFFLLTCMKNDTRFLFVEKRRNNDIWKNLYQLPLAETDSPEIPEQLPLPAEAISMLKSKGFHPEITGKPVTYKHQLSHQTLEASFYKIILPQEYCFIFEQYYKKVSLEEFESMGKPVLISRYIAGHITGLSETTQ